jgi:1-acyl-sn-glycerol-3-phosphate acyltransferase
VRDPRIDRDLLARQFFPVVRRLIRVGYFKFEVEGIEHVPREGRVVHAQNHAGWFPLDAFFITFAIAEAYGLERAPYFATYDAALSAPLLGPFMRRFGAVPASWFRRPERLPDEIESCAIFPEGVRGNTKPFWQAYRMRPWNRGFVRVAVARDCPIVPGAIFGGEESMPVAWQVKFLKPVLGATLGLPFTPIPLPARWKIVFLPPVRLGEEGRRSMNDPQLCSDIAHRIQHQVQDTLDREGGRYPLAQLSSIVAAVRQKRKD